MNRGDAIPGIAPDRQGVTFAGLADHPRLLFAVCFALNAVLLPYAGIYHDAELYAGQTLQAADGRFSDDLFFKYGGQSRFTLLPDILAPLALRFGVEPVFFVAYLVSNAVRLWATQQLVFRLLGRTQATAAGLLLNAATQVPLGISGVFQVNELYFTARVPAIAFGIAGMERALAGRWVSAIVLLALSAACHPLIAAPAVGVVVVWAVGEWATPRQRLAVAGAVAVAGVAYLGATWGTLDATWRGLVIAKGTFMDPLHWGVPNVFRLAIAAGCAITVAVRLADPSARRFLTVIVAIAGVGVTVAAIAAHGSWALLFQVQAYRAVWPLELLRFPVGLTVAARLWADPTRRLAGLALFAALLAPTEMWNPVTAPVLAVGVTAGWLAMRPRVGETDHYTDRASVVAFTVGAIGLFGVAMIRLVQMAGYEQFENLDFGQTMCFVGDLFGPIPRFALVLAAVGLLLRAVPRPFPAAVVTAVVGLIAAVATFTAPSFDRFDPHGNDVRFVCGVLNDRKHGPGPPTVYWPGLDVRTVWLGVGVNSYFTLSQMAGNTFSRENAVEGDRRLNLVFRFEIDQYRREYGALASTIVGEDLSGLADLPPPTPEDFRALAALPGIDFLVLPSDFSGAVASNGSVWVYDLRAGRAGVTP